MRLGERIRESRIRLGMTQLQLAEATRVPKESISRIERGLNQPRSATLAKLAPSLGMTLTEILGNEGAEDAFLSLGDLATCFLTLDESDQELIRRMCYRLAEKPA